MDLETKTVILPVDENFEAELQKLKADGWEMRRDIPAVYHLVRLKHRPETMAHGEMKFDELKVFVMGADGVIRKQ